MKTDVLIAYIIKVGFNNEEYPFISGNHKNRKTTWDIQR